MSDKPVVLTAELARLALESKEDVLLEEADTGDVFNSVMRLENLCGENIVRAVESIRDGRTVVVPADELARLRAEVEKYRGGIHTHGPDCWSWGWRHYECAEREIARLRERVAELESGEPVAWSVTEDAINNRVQFTIGVQTFTLDWMPDEEPETRRPWMADMLRKALGRLGPQRMTEAQAREAFDKWAKDYALEYEPNYNHATRMDCLAAFKAGLLAGEGGTT